MQVGSEQAEGPSSSAPNPGGPLGVPVDAPESIAKGLHPLYHISIGNDLNILHETHSFNPDSFVQDLVHQNAAGHLFKSEVHGPDNCSAVFDLVVRL